jgi:hypothetical protein
MGLLELITLDFNVIDRRLIRYFAFHMFVRRNGNIVWLYISCIYTLRKCVSLSNSSGLKFRLYQPFLLLDPEQCPKH